MQADPGRTVGGPLCPGSDWRRGLGQNYDQDHNQDREDQRARTEEYDLAYHVGLE
jgi:hypothetical protein